MPATTVETATDVGREPDAATATSKSAVTLNYEAMFAALNDLLGALPDIVSDLWAACGARF